jgi:hypothetical protein
LSGLEEAADDGFVPDANIDDQLEELEKKAKEEEEKESADSVRPHLTCLEKQLNLNLCVEKLILYAMRYRLQLARPN